MKPLSKDGNILTIADRLIMVTEWFHNEITYWYRVIAGGGTVANRGLVEDLYKLWEQHGRLDNIRVSWVQGAGSVQRTSGIYRFFSKLFTLRTDANDVTQTTANSQPYVVNGAMVNPNGASRFMTHPTVSFGAGDAWSVGFIAMYNGGNGSSSIGTVELFGTNLDTSNRLLFKSGAVDYSFGFTNSLGSFVSFAAGSKKIIGKLIYGNLIADGVGNLSLYLNGELNSVKAITTSFVLTTVMAGRPNSFFPGYLSMYSIQSGALNPTQIIEEYNLLRSYIPEIATTLIGTDEIATENCQMVATPMGRVINLNNTAGNVELITNAADREFSSDTGWWLKSSGFTIGGGVCKVSATSNGSISKPNTLVVGRYYRVRFKISNKTGNTTYGIRLRQNSNPTTTGINVSTSFNNDGVYEVYGVAQGTSLAFYAFGIVGDYYLELDDVSYEEVGWNGAKQMYDTLISQGSTVSAALLAAAMWRSPDADLDKQAVFSKIYNDYAAALMRFDIDAYNTANPSTPWGYHVMTRAEEQALAALDADTLKSNDLWASTNGTNETGLSLLGSGVINADGTYSNFGTKTRLMTGEGYALDVNDDGTSAEIAVTTEGGILRLVKD